MSRYKAYQEGVPNDTPAGGPWFVTVPDGGHIEIGYDANGKPDEYHARLFASAEALVKALQAAREYLESDVADGFRPAERLTAEIDQALACVGGSKE